MEAARLERIAASWAKLARLSFLDPKRLAFGRVPFTPNEFFSRDVIRLLRPSGRVLELGCGPAVNSCWALAEGADEAVGVDVSPGALEGARSCASYFGVGDRLTLIEGDYRDVDGRFDVILAVQILNYELDIDEFMRRCVSWLEPGGVLLVSDGQAARRSAAVALKQNPTVRRVFRKPPLPTEHSDVHRHSAADVRAAALNAGLAPIEGRFFLHTLGNALAKPMYQLASHEFRRGWARRAALAAYMPARAVVRLESRVRRRDASGAVYAWVLRAPAMGADRASQT